MEDWKSSITSSHRTALGRQVTEAMSIATGQSNVVLLNSKHEFGANAVNELVVMKGGLILGNRNQKRKREGGEEAPTIKIECQEAVVEEEDNSGNQTQLEGPNDTQGNTRYAHWTKREMEDECKRRRVSVKGGQDGMSRRLIKEDKEQPRLQFKTNESRLEAVTWGNVQRIDQREEGGGGGEGGSQLSTGEVEEEQWEDISSRGEDDTGSEAKEAHHTLRRKTSIPGRTNQSPRKNRRGFWLGRKTKLMGEASKKQNIKNRVSNQRSVETKTP